MFPERWYLAIVEVGERDAAQPSYVRAPFRQAPEEAATSVNYTITDLLAAGARVEAPA